MYPAEACLKKETIQLSRILKDSIAKSLIHRDYGDQDVLYSIKELSPGREQNFDALSD